MIARLRLRLVSYRPLALALLALSAGPVGCGGSSAADSASQDLSAAGCKAVTQLQCAEGFVITTDGCKQPSAPAAQSVAHGRCVADDCEAVTHLACGADEVVTTEGCAQPSAPAAQSVARARCVSDGCGPVTQLTCAKGKITTDGCVQASAPAAVSVARGRCID